MPEHGRMSTIRVQYGLRIKDLRDERGLSQRGFAARIGMSPTYLADVERGARIAGRVLPQGKCLFKEIKL